MDTITTFLNIRIDYGFKKDLFDASDTHNMVNEEVVAYSQSLQKLRATQAGIRYASQQALEKGREEGRVEGMEMGLRRVIINMLSMGAQWTR